MGLPLEETGATLAPVAAVMLMALRATITARLHHAQDRRRDGAKAPRARKRPPA
jgi:hypothetical protein